MVISRCCITLLYHAAVSRCIIGNTLINKIGLAFVAAISSELYSLTTKYETARTAASTTSSGRSEQKSSQSSRRLVPNRGLPRLPRKHPRKKGALQLVATVAAPCRSRELEGTVATHSAKLLQLPPQILATLLAGPSRPLPAQGKEAGPPPKTRIVGDLPSDPSVAGLTESLATKEAKEAIPKEASRGARVRATKDPTLSPSNLPANLPNLLAQAP